MRWPNFFIVGATKAGTTSLYNYLQDVDEVYMSPIKEPSYFATNCTSAHALRGRVGDKRKYLTLFANAGNAQAVGEASPRYLKDPAAPQGIFAEVPDAKIIISLRDPIDRLFSDYLMRRRTGVTDLSIDETVRRIVADPDEREGEEYTQHVRRWIERFGPERVKIIIFEEWRNHVEAVVEELLDFLGLERSPNHPRVRSEEIYNPYMESRAPWVSGVYNSFRHCSKYVPGSVRHYLRDRVVVPFLFREAPKPKLGDAQRNALKLALRPDVEHLEALLGRELPWKHFRDERNDVLAVNSPAS